MIQESFLASCSNSASKKAISAICTPKKVKTITPKIASLFAGIGGIDLAFQRAGFSVEWANEIDAKACATYATNFSHLMICDDIKNIKEECLPKVDVLTAGFPCQAFSIAGLQRGFEDTRGSIFFEVMRLAQTLKPRVLFLENVKNLVSHQKGETFESIKSAIEKIGYHIKYQVLNTAEYSNIPQNRERIYIVCFKDVADLKAFEFPSKTTDLLSVRDLLDDHVNQIYYYNKAKCYPILKESIVDKNTVYQWRRRYVRSNKSNLCPTLTANMGTGGHNVPLILDEMDIRKLTPRECARIQGFPDDFVLPEQLPDTVLYKQIGNSVSVPVVQKIAKNILAVLSKNFNS